MKRLNALAERHGDIVLPVGIVGFLGAPVAGAMCITSGEWFGAAVSFALIPVANWFVSRGLDAETL